MNTAVRTRFTERGLSVGDGGDGTHLDLFSGALHYWRVDPDDWGACLAAMKSIGLHIVESYVPWAVHDSDDAPDLPAFLDAVAGARMHAVLRPGPHINAELTGFGFPERILNDDGMRAVSARDTPVWLPAPPHAFAVPSYAARPFRAAVTAWFGRFGEMVAPYLAPDGPVVAVQVDNEFQMFFRVGAYDHDYHPDALEWWNEFSGGLEAPRAWSAGDAGRCARWVQFKEQYAARSLRWMTEALDAAGLDGIAKFHNFPPSEPWLINTPAGEAAIGGVAGLDFYHTAGDWATYSRRAAHLVGSTSRVPFAPELGAGGPLWLMPMSARDQRNVTLGVLAAGVRAFNLYMAVERERWYGSPISDTGEVRETGRWIERLLDALREVDWTSLHQVTPVGVIVSRADARFGVASSLADPLTPVVTELMGVGADLSRDEDAREQRRWARAIREALLGARVPHLLVDEGCDVERLGAFDALVMPTLRRVDRALWKKLGEVAAAGTKIVIGPGKPTLDEHGEPLGDDGAIPEGVGRIQKASLEDPKALAADLATLAGGAPTQWIAKEPDCVCSVFDDNNGPRVMFVANTSGEARSADLVVPAGVTLTDALSGAGVPRKLPLDPFQVVMLRVSRG